jgi:hypothetical protein
VDPTQDTQVKQFKSHCQLQLTHHPRYRLLHRSSLGSVCTHSALDLKSGNRVYWLLVPTHPMGPECSCLLSPCPEATDPTSSSWRFLHISIATYYLHTY